MTDARPFWSWFWIGAPAGSAMSVPRDPRIDVFRGLALLIIFVDHVSGNWLSRLTPSAMGFSDAAEAFVLLAGFSCAVAYGTAIDRRGLVNGSAQIVARAWKLYTAHIGLFVFMAVAVAAMAVKVGNPLYYEHVNIVPFFQDPANAVLGMVTLLFLPNYLDILPLYIVLLAMLPILWVAARVSPALALALSVALYVASGHYGLNIPNVQTGGVWFFNPFAWQLIFTIGMIAALGSMHAVRLPRSPVLTIIAVSIVLFGLVNAAPWTFVPGLEGLALPDLWRIDADKTNLSLWRFSHSLALAYLIACGVAPASTWLSKGFGRLLGLAGRHSLPLFCLGVMLSLAGTFVFFEIGREWPLQIAVNVVGMGLLLGAARMLEWYKSAVQAPVPSRSKPVNEAKTA